jgi:hypothetical protein
MNGIPGSDYRVQNPIILYVKKCIYNMIHLQGLLALVKDHVRGQDDVEADTMCTLRNNSLISYFIMHVKEKGVKFSEKRK